MRNFILAKPGLQSYSCNNCITCLRSCSKEGFEAVNVLIANISGANISGEI